MMIEASVDVHLSKTVIQLIKFSAPNMISELCIAKKSDEMSPNFQTEFHLEH
jgi:hypothetical protein